jgi:hypothetical protein
MVSMGNRFKIFLLFFSFLCVSFSVAADTITGTVRNQTTNQPAVGHEVILLRLGEDMQEEARTKTNAQGAFTLSVVSPNDQHVVRVLHQGVNYDQAVRGRASMEMIVYDAVSRVSGLNGQIGICKVESDGQVLKVAEMYAITNASNPPVAQFRPDNLEISVPDKAVFDSVEVRSGRGLWVKVAPDPVPGQKGKFDINFPLRPGDTLLKFVYHLPYQDSVTFHLKLPYPILKFAVMHPPSMTFQALRPDTFKSPGLASGLQVEQAVGSPLVGDVPAFKISGVGRAREPEPQTGTAPPTVSASPGDSHSSEINPPSAADRPRKELWLLDAGVVVILSLGLFTLWRRRAQIPAVVNTRPGAGNFLLDVLKEELFQLESQLLHGDISEQEYATTKQALGKSIQRVLARK